VRWCYLFCTFRRHCGLLCTGKCLYWHFVNLVCHNAIPPAWHLACVIAINAKNNTSFLLLLVNATLPLWRVGWGEKNIDVLSSLTEGRNLRLDPRCSFPGIRPGTHLTWSKSWIPSLIFLQKLWASSWSVPLGSLNHWIAVLESVQSRCLPS
jgi:hypothetical protein